jgi:hypothetical protein
MAKHFALQPAARITINIPGYNPKKQAERLRIRQENVRKRFEKSTSKAETSNSEPANSNASPEEPRLETSSQPASDHDALHEQEINELNASLEFSGKAHQTLLALASCFK